MAKRLIAPVLVASLTLAAAGLSACGFTPLYGETGVAPGLTRRRERAAAAETEAEVTGGEVGGAA